MRINKLLSNLGYCSRRQANRWIEEGLLTVNGQLCQGGQWLESEDVVLLEGQPLLQQPRLYILLNKPTGITCTAESKVKDNIIDFMNLGDYVFPVGRLDKDSHGLMFLTNDGELAHRVLEADHAREKEYEVTLDKPIEEGFLESMSQGVVIEGIMTNPCTVYKIDVNTMGIVLTQGLNRQIRKMCFVFGYEAVDLKRIRIVNLLLGDLGIGQWRPLTTDELTELKDQMLV